MSEIEQFHVGRLRQHFDEIPARSRQSVRMRQLTPKGLRDTALKLVEVAKERNQPPPSIGLGLNTIRKHLGNLAEFFRYLRGRGYALRELTLEDLRPAKLKPPDIRTLTSKPGPDKLAPLYRMPVFTGCRGANAQAQGGNACFTRRITSYRCCSPISAQGA